MDDKEWHTPRKRLHGPYSSSRKRKRKFLWPTPLFWGRWLWEGSVTWKGHQTADLSLTANGWINKHKHASHRGSELKVDELRKGYVLSEIKMATICLSLVRSCIPHRLPFHQRKHSEIKKNRELMRLDSCKLEPHLPSGLLLSTVPFITIYNTVRYRFFACAR